MVGFLFGSGTGETAASLKRRRDVVDALQAQIMGETPKTYAQGIGALLKGAAAGIGKYRLDQTEKQGADKATALFNSIVGGPDAVAATGSAAAFAAPGVAGEMAATDPKPVSFSGNQQEFIDAMLPAAMEEGKRLGVDPRIIVGQAALETGYGKHAPGGNYFGIKSHGKDGGNSLMTTEVVDGKPVRVRDSFRAYSSMGDSVRGYGDFISSNPRYKDFQAAEGLDNELAALQASGYATDPNYGAKVGSIARGIKLPNEVASLDPSAGMTAADAIERQAPAQAPQQSLSDEVAAFQQTPEYQAQFPGRQQPAAGSQQQPMQVAQAIPQQEAAPAQGNALGVDPRVLNLLSNPFLDPQQRNVLENLANQQMRDAQSSRENEAWRQRQDYQQQLEQNDPLYRLKLQAAQREVEQGKTQPLINAGGGQIYDPNKKEWLTPPGKQGDGGAFRFGGNSVEAQSLNGLMDSGQLTPEQAQQLGAGKTITGPNGEIIFLTPQGVFGQAAGGQPQPLSGAQAQDGVDIGLPPFPDEGRQPPAQAEKPQQRANGNLTITEPKVTLDEKKAMTFADRMKASGALIDEFEKAGLSTKDQFIRGNDYIPDFMENWMVGNDFQNFDQARRDFINAQLRRESGAVISPEEFDNANKQYFPQPGDGAAVLEQKRRNRKVVMDGMARDGGPTYGNKAGAGDYKTRYGLE